MIKVEADPFIYGSVSGKSSKEMNYNINLNLPDSIKELMFQQQLVQQMKRILAQKQNQVQALTKQNQQLQAQCQARDRKILLLGQSVSEMASEANKIKENLKQKETLIRNYNSNLYEKNVEMQSLELKHKSEVEGFMARRDQQIASLRQIISAQQQEISELMNDHQIMVATMRKISNAHDLHSDQQNILEQFNKQLETQIDQLENQNENLIVELGQTRKQLKLQNQQGEDLMSQVGVMVEHMQTKAAA